MSELEETKRLTTHVAEMNSNVEEPRNQDFLKETLTSNKNVVCRRVSAQNLTRTSPKFCRIACVFEGANMESPLESLKCM